MPNLPKRACSSVGCKEFVPCPKHYREWRRIADSRRGSAHARGYTLAWAQYSKARLFQYPLCVDPFGEHGQRIVPATVTDHKTPHKGNKEKFWDQANHQSLCKPCHDRKSATEIGTFDAGEERREPEGIGRENCCELVLSF